MKEINEKVYKVYDFTVNYLKENGFPPSIREICEKLNIKSTATAYSYVEKLKNMGLLEKSPLKKRAITPAVKQSKVNNVPVLGVINAGSPIFAVENLEGYIPLSDDFNTKGSDFALKVRGDSMINAGIYNNDIIIVHQQNTAKNGDIVVAMVEDSATVKRFFLKDGKVILHPENDLMDDMVFPSVQILGTVIGLMRKF